MATAIVTKMPPAGIPGLTVIQLGMDEWEVKGASDALEAAGATVPQLAHVRTPWPKGTQPFPFQAVGTDQLHAILRRHGGALLADEMGLGKTPQAAVVAAGMLKVRERTLVVCPAAVRHQWVKWMALSTGNGIVYELGPPSQKPRKKLVEGRPPDPDFPVNWANWLQGDGLVGVTSYPLFHQALVTKPKPKLVIFDEIHNYFQGRRNKYVDHWYKFSGMIDYKLGVTGSPLVSKPAGLWQILNVLLGMRFGRAREFDMRYCLGHDDPGGWWNNKGSDPKTAPELAQRLHHYMVRRMKADVASQMPKVTRTVRWVEGTPAARGAMARMAYTAHGMRQAMDPTLHGKISEVVDVAQEANAPCVIFCWRRSDCDLVAAAMEKAGESTLTVTGEHDASTRAAMVRHATARKQHVVTTYGASGTGLDGLQHLSANAIFHAVDPVPATLLQAIARLDRIGQTLPVTATVIAMRDSVDEIIVDRVWDRLESHQAVLGKDLGAAEMSKALRASGLDDERFLSAIFDEMTNSNTGGSDE